MELTRQEILSLSSDEVVSLDPDTYACVALYAAILKNAVDEWNDAMTMSVEAYYWRYGLGSDLRRQEIKNLRHFFNSEWFEEICEILSDDPEWLAKTIRDRTVNIRRIVRHNQSDIIHDQQIRLFG